jgi:thioredoxin
MATENLTMEKFETTIENNDMVLIDFWAEWCGPCKMFGPIYEKASEKHSDVVFTKCNTEEEQDLAGHFGIRSIPTLAIFRDKILLYIQPGALHEGALEDIISRIKGLDMDEIRAKMAEEGAKGAKDKMN